LLPGPGRSGFSLDNYRHVAPSQANSVPASRDFEGSFSQPVLLPAALDLAMDLVL
jgi:hypothetical protein